MPSTFINKTLKRQVQTLGQRGGQHQKAAEKCQSILYKVQNRTQEIQDILAELRVTKHGESRIDHCVKYDLTGYCRLVTIQDNGWVFLLYVGDHNEVDEWLAKNRGLKVGIKDEKSGLFDIYISEDIHDDEARISPEIDYASGKLYQKLKQYWSDFSQNMHPTIKKILESFDATVEDEDILDAATLLPDKSQQDVVVDVFLLLRGGKYDDAKNRILVSKDEITLIEEIPLAEVPSIPSNDQYINLDDLEEVDLKILMNNKDWLEWMLFLHPSQRKVVDQDFKGSARLLGVSGSGKTCVLVKRVIRLAQKYPGERILLLTLNQSLSQLTKQLVDKMLTSADCQDLGNFIDIYSFWELGKKLIEEFDRRPLTRRVLQSKTDIHGETIDEIFTEYYTCETNNDDAEVLLPVHRTLLGRSIFPQDYLRQEFDWIRSFLPVGDERIEYLDVLREGRYIPILPQFRASILRGLQGWEEKMEAVGAIDYLGITNRLFSHVKEIQPRYRCILVDEVQDFGTMELKIIRHLVPEGENDLFLTGDIAQQVYTKHHKHSMAGITIPANGYYQILKNYRNSREILEAAYSVFNTNTDPIQYQSDDFEVLNPEYGNFSSPKPFLRKAIDLTDEFSSAFSYLTEILDEKELGCIVLSGYSIFEVQNLANGYGLLTLDGQTTIGSSKIYLSDLDQTKGFEFDRVVIINANQSSFPNPSLPREEWFREISKLYVAMTRAKKELIVSYSDKLSEVFSTSRDSFSEDFWSDHPIENKIEWTLAPPAGMVNTKTESYYSDSGKKFLYRKAAVGLSPQAQDKLISTVTGSIGKSGKKQTQWRTMGELKSDLQKMADRPHYTSLFGTKVLEEIIGVLK